MLFGLFVGIVIIDVWLMIFWVVFFMNVGLEVWFVGIC